MIDYLIVGSGLAGISFAEIALQHNKSIRVLNDDSQNSSKIAGGLYNPVILKRFTVLNQAEEQLRIMHEFFSFLEKKLNTKVDFQTPILRKFFSAEEQNNWFAASDKVKLAPFLSTSLISKKYSSIDSPFGFGEVLQTGYIDTASLLVKYKEYLALHKLLTEESFDYSLLKEKENGVEYKDIQARHIIFAEGFGMHANPFFKHLPLDGTKGELLVIKAPDLDLDVIINASVFILPLGDGLFKVGATYEWDDKTDIPTEDGKKELVEKIKEVINCDFEIVSHFAGVRPTVKDRKPLVGTFSGCNSIHILNGLGTRGVMLGPAMAKELFEHIEYQKPLDKAIDIKRYEKKK